MNEINFGKFIQEGFFIYNPNFNNQILINAQDSFKKTLEICQKKEYNYVRVYDDYSATINLAGIEMIFDE